MMKLARLAACALFTIALAWGLPAAAADPATVSFRCASSDTVCSVTVRLGTLESPDQAIPYGTRHLDKGAAWDVDSGGLFVFYKAKDGTWQRIAATHDMKIDTEFCRICGPPLTGARALGSLSLMNSRWFRSWYFTSLQRIGAG